MATVLVTDGLWLRLPGSTEGPAREVGPPRRSPRDIVDAVEPFLEIVELRSTEFTEHKTKAWVMLARRRTIAAQPSSRRG